MARRRAEEKVKSAHNNENSPPPDFTGIQGGQRRRG